MPEMAHVFEDREIPRHRRGEPIDDTAVARSKSSPARTRGRERDNSLSSDTGI